MLREEFGMADAVAREGKAARCHADAGQSRHRGLEVAARRRLAAAGIAIDDVGKGMAADLVAHGGLAQALDEAAGEEKRCLPFVATGIECEPVVPRPGVLRACELRMMRGLRRAAFEGEVPDHQPRCARLELVEECQQLVENLFALEPADFAVTRDAVEVERAPDELEVEAQHECCRRAAHRAAPGSPAAGCLRATSRNMLAKARSSGASASAGCTGSRRRKARGSRRGVSRSIQLSGPV